MFKTPPTQEWVDAHKDDDEPEVIGPPAPSSIVEQEKWRLHHDKGELGLASVIDGKNKFILVSIPERDAQITIDTHNASIERAVKQQRAQ